MEPTLPSRGGPGPPKPEPAPAARAELERTDLLENPEGPTGAAPPFRPLLPTVVVPTPADGARARSAGLGVGDLLGDFELLRVLGAGSYGRVFLARQISLGRLVALKVTSEGGEHLGGEARTLARLEHVHIVQVFSESFEPEQGLRLLCMQYVPGATLEVVLRTLGPGSRSNWSGQVILDALDAAGSDAVFLDPASLREREFLAGCPFDEAVCWLGARLAEALAHAHGFGVLHRDVKPANVLLNRYGRPFLADFNVASARRSDGAAPAPLGGTLGYMAPEHLDAFCGVGSVGAVAERADLYSLGMVLFELLAGQPAFPIPRRGSTAEVARQLSAVRRAGPPEIPAEAGVPAPLAAVVRRCLEPNPARRFPNATTLARTLDGCRAGRRVEKELPPAGPLTRALQRWPLLLGCLFGLLPHLLGSVVNVSYNALHIVGELTPAQQTAFQRLVLGYNAVVYPVCVLVLVVLIRDVQRRRRRLREQGFADAADEAAARRAVLRLPSAAVLLSCVGWLPGGLLFPLGIGLLADPVGMAVFAHFLVSFTIAGVIALTYSFLAIDYVALRVLYPSLWTNAHQVQALARAELRGQGRRIGWAQVLAVLIPLSAAVLMIGVGPEEFSTEGYRAFRLLVTALIALGMAGLGVAMTMSRLLREVLAAFTGGERES
jgi:serine/threonine protein kinase